MHPGHGTDQHPRQEEGKKSQNPAEFKNDKCSFIAPYSRLGMEVRRLQPRGRVVRNLIHTKQKTFPTSARENRRGLKKPLIADETFGGCNVLRGQRLLELLGGVFTAEAVGLWFHKAVIHPWNGMDEMLPFPLKRLTLRRDQGLADRGAPWGPCPASDLLQPVLQPKVLQILTEGSCPPPLPQR